MNTPRALPPCTMLPLTEGQLLVSREHATFCHIPAAHVHAVADVLAGRASLDVLGGELLEQLEQHGFFASPRRAEAASPSVQIQLTNACNLECTYCCTNSGRAREEEITLDKVRGVLEATARIMGAGTRVAFLGGEPFLVPWAVEASQVAMDLGLELTLFTNGVPLAQPELAAQVAALQEHGVKVRISLAGPTHELCDRESQAPRYDGAIEGIRQLCEHGGTCAVDLMLTPQQAAETAAELHALRQELPRGVSIALGVLYLSGREQGEHLFSSRAELEEALDRIAFQAGERIEAPRPSPVAARREGCGCALGHHLHVRSDGALFSCFKMEERVGHLHEGGFEEALALLHGQPHPASSLDTCDACPLNTLCGGGCRSENLLYTGDPDLVPCGEWRVRVLCELLAEDHTTALEWPVPHLLAEARARGIPAPDLFPVRLSRHLLET